MIEPLRISGRIFCMLLMVWSVANSSRVYSQSGEVDAMSVVAAEVDKIRSEPSSATRTKYAQRLADEIRQNKLAVSDGADIDLLANLLTDRDDSVRYWIAMALGYLGPRARQAVPALEKALKERECDNSSKTSASGIEFALSRIGVMSIKPTRTDC